jgi:oxygen-independent coproporphyrinogen-3 oxidase
MDELAFAEDFLSANGYERYEISNYRKAGSPGCLHNLAVWRGEDYSGIGPAAASREGLARRVNAADWRAWAEDCPAAGEGRGGSETLAPDEDERERFLTGLRLASGISPDPATALGRARLGICGRLERAGLLLRRPGGGDGSGAFALTRRGREVADSVAAEFC